MSLRLSTSKQDAVIVEHMSVADFWVKNLGGDLQENDQEELQGHLYLKLVEVVREKLTDEVENVKNWLSVQMRFAAYDWLIALRKLPITNHDFEVPDEFKEMPMVDVMDLLQYACQNEREERVANLLMAGVSRDHVAIVTGVQPQRISELKKRIFDRAKRKNNRLEKAQTVRRSSSHFPRTVHGKG